MSAQETIRIREAKPADADAISRLITSTAEQRQQAAAAARREAERAAREAVLQITPAQKAAFDAARVAAARTGERAGRHGEGGTF